MPKITFINADGQQRVVSAGCGTSLMEAAVQNMVSGIDADCGGVAACGTCHVYIDPAWVAKVGPANEGHEAQMLTLTDNAAPNSRLSCQVQVTDELDGLVVRIPTAQH